MSYGLKYYTEFKDYYDRVMVVNFYYNNYSGSSTELKSMADPGEIYQPDNETNVFTPIRGSELRVNLLSETDFQLIDLFVTGNRDVKVVVTMDGSTFWTGWLIPNQYNESYIAAPYPVTITARDGLGELKTFEFEYDTLLSPMAIMGTVLNKLELDIPLWESVNLYEDTYMVTTASDSPLNQCQYFSKNYKGENCYDVLSDILTGLGSEIQQKDGEWKVTRIKETVSDLYKRRFDIAFTGIGIADETEDLTKLIGRPKDRFMANLDAEIIASPGWNSLDIERDTGRMYFFDNHLFDGDYETIGSGQVAKGWTASTGTAVEKAYVNKSLKQKVSDFNTLSTFTHLIQQQSAGANEVTALEFQEFSFRVSMAIIKGSAYSGSTVLANMKTQILLTSTDLLTTRYLDADGVWQSSRTYIEFQNVEAKLLKDLSFVDYEVKTGLVPFDGSITITLFAPYPVTASDFSKLDSWYLQEASGDIWNTQFGEYLNNGFLKEVDTLPLYPINANMTYIPNFNIEFKFGDYPGYDNRRLIYRNGIVHSLFDYTPTESWKARGGVVSQSLFLHLTDDYKYIYEQNRWILRGTILSQDLRFDSTIVDYQVNNRKYYCKSGTYNLRSCQLSGIFHEIGAWEGSPWILADGTWNDDGIWVDGDVWID